MRSRLRSFRRHQWSPVERALLIAGLAIVMGCLFVTTYSLALGDPVPHRIKAALVGDRAGGGRALGAVEKVAQDSLVFRSFASVPAALHAIDEQTVYAALSLTSRPTLYVASGAGASVARVLERIDLVDPAVRVIDTHPRSPHDPSGVDIFYLMLVATIIGFITVFQVRGAAGELPLRHHISFVLGLAVAGSLALTFVDGPLLDRPAGVFPEEWAILALHLTAVSSFASLMAVTLGRWAILPTWLFFVILGNTSSGGAVAPPLLPQPFAFLSQWLPSGATVTALRDAIYFRHFQHVRPLAVLGVWVIGLFVLWLVVSHRLQARQAAASEPAAAAPAQPA